MNLYNIPLQELTFEMIAEFCRSSGQREDIQLDYKLDMPKKGIAKYFASFANTRGGIMIFGVEEDKNTGLPIKYEGVADVGSLVEQINQYATNVDPRPHYDVHTTELVNNKGFVVLKVFEGDRTPYYVLNDANLWIRTGNISDPIQQAPAEVTELLFGKAKKAGERREKHMIIVKNVLEEAKIELGVNPDQRGRGFLSLWAQPFNPSTSLIEPSEIENNLQSVVYRTRHWEFPVFTNPYQIRSIPCGTLGLSEKDRKIEIEQFYATGLAHRFLEVITQDNRNSEKGTPFFRMTGVSGELLAFLGGIRNFLKFCKYNGSILGKVTLNGVKGSYAYPLVPEGYSPTTFWKDDAKTTLLDDYSWDISFDTSAIQTEQGFYSLYSSILKAMMWDLGLKVVGDNLIKAFFDQNRGK